MPNNIAADIPLLSVSASETSKESKTKKINFGILDSLRGIAALYVVLNHCRTYFFIGGSKLSTMNFTGAWKYFVKAYVALMQTTVLGSEFVVFFFVLSGFSITYSVLNNKGTTFDFYLRRLIRIYPPFLLGLLLTFAIYRLIANAGMWSLAEIKPGSGKTIFDDWLFFIKNLFYINDGVTFAPQYWSLRYEVVFYILAPFFMRNIKAYIYISSALYILNLFSPTLVTERGFLLSYLFEYNFYFSAGVGLFYYYKDHGMFFKSRNRRIVLLLAMFICMIPLHVIGSSYSTIAAKFLACCGAGILINDWLKTNYEHKILRKFGEFSYSIYVYHYALMYLFVYICYKLNLPFLPHVFNVYTMLLAISFCVAGAYLLSLISEYPSKLILGKLRKRESVNAR